MYVKCNETTEHKIINRDTVLYRDQALLLFFILIVYTSVRLQAVKKKEIKYDINWKVLERKKEMS